MLSSELTVSVHSSTFHPRFTLFNIVNSHRSIMKTEKETKRKQFFHNFLHMLTSYNIVVHGYQANRKIHQLIFVCIRKCIAIVVSFVLFIHIFHYFSLIVQCTTSIYTCIHTFIYIYTYIFTSIFVWWRWLFLVLFLQCTRQFVPPLYCSCLNTKHTLTLCSYREISSWRIAKHYFFLDNKI